MSTPSPPRKRSPFALIAVVIVLLLAAGAVGGAWWVRQPVGGPDKPVRVTVTPGESVSSIGSDLESKKLIRSAFYFGQIGGHTTIAPGIYDVSPAERPTHILKRLRAGDVVKVKVTFPEGFTNAQIAHRLHRLGLIPDEDAFLDLVTRKGISLKASFPLPTNLEGYLFPDTYRFPLGATPEQIVQRMVDEFDTLVAKEHSSDIASSGRSLTDLVNIAAMVEREAETDADRPKIAGVINNRLAKGMRLEIDATVQYARGEHKSRLMNSDLTVESPYNTYKVKGLPAGPICNPGLPSLEAAMHPEKSEYLFYVAGGPDGKSHVFARTLAEHQQNVAQYRKSAAAHRAAAASAP